MSFWRDTGGASLVGSQSELPLDGGLNAIAVEDFALDFGGLYSLVADNLDFEGILIIGPDMLESADEFPGLEQEPLFQRLQSH